MNHLTTVSRAAAALVLALALTAYAAASTSASTGDAGCGCGFDQQSLPRSPDAVEGWLQACLTLH